MKVTLKTKDKAAVTATLVEILGNRVTVCLENGNYADYRLQDIAEFNGRVTFQHDKLDEVCRSVFAFEMQPTTVQPTTVQHEVVAPDEVDDNKEGQELVKVLNEIAQGTRKQAKV